MNTFVNGISAIVATLTGTPTFYHDPAPELNISADFQATTSTVVLMPFMNLGSTEKLGGAFKDTQKIVLIFAKQVQFEDSTYNKQATYTAMKTMFNQFAVKMNASTLFDHPTRYEREYVEIHDANLAGLAVTFDLKLRTPVSSC
jgi:hypothetical protein